MGKKTLYVHIGMAKTGTTALQGFLWENRAVLEKYGYCYPSMKCAYSNFSVVNERRNGHFLVNDMRVDDTLKHREMDEAMYRAGMEEIVRLFGMYDNIVLSDESIWASTYKQRANLWEELAADGQAHGFAVKIIVYLRRQDQYMASLYRQKIARRKNNGSRKTWEDFITHIAKMRQLDYFEKLERIRETLGQEAMIVCRYERGGFYGDDLYADFLHRIGLSYTDEFALGQQEANKSLLGNTVELKRVLNGIDDLNRDDDFVMREILYAYAGVSRDEVGAELFAKEEAEAFLRQYEQSNDAVARTYFGDGRPLFDDTVRDLPKYERDNPQMVDDVLRFAAMGLKYVRREQAQQFKEQQETIMHLQNQIEALQERLAQMQGQIKEHRRETKDVRGELYATRDKLHHPIRAVVSRITKS